MLNQKQLMDFLNVNQQNSLEGYRLIKPDEKKERVKKKDYVKYMSADNYTFYEGGFVIGINLPEITMMRWSDRQKQVLNVSKQYVFFKQNPENISRRTFLQGLLENLKGKINLTKTD